MLLIMASGIARLLLYTTAAATDAARHHPDPAVRADAAARVDLLTPLAKAWSTDEGVRLTSLAVQVHGGMGYIEETGIAQRYRDARIAPIYEGTNGIQAIDLVARKVRRDGGAALWSLIMDLAVASAAVDGRDDTRQNVAILNRALSAVDEATSWVLAAETDDDWLAAAAPYLELVALTTCGGLLARQAAWALGRKPTTEADAVVGRFGFFAVERLAVAPGLLDAITAGSRRVSAAHLG